MISTPLPIIALVLSSILSMCIIIACWERRVQVSARMMMLLALSVVLFSLSYAFELSSGADEMMLFWWKASLLGAVFIAPTWLFFVLAFTHNEKWLHRRWMLLVLFVPVLGIVAGWTNEYHNLFASQIRFEELGAIRLLLWHKGPLFWINSIYATLLGIIAFVFLARYVVLVPFKEKAHGLLLILSGTFPWIGSAALGTMGWPDDNYYLMPLSFLASSALWLWIILQLNIFDILPIAWSLVVEHMPDSVIVLDLQSRVINLNPMAEILLGDVRANLAGKRLTDLLNGQLALNNGQATGERKEEVSLELGGLAQQYELSLSPLYDQPGKQAGRLLVLRNITETKRAEQALRESESRFRTLIEESLVGVTLTDEWGFIIEWNPTIERITGILREEALGKDLFDLQKQMTPGGLITPEQEYAMRMMIRRALQKGEAPGRGQPIQVLIERKTDGAIRAVEQTTFCIRSEHGYRLGAISSDVTERRRAEDELVKAQRDLRNVITSNPDGMIVLDPSWKILFANSAVEALWGHPLEDLIGKHFSPVPPGGSRGSPVIEIQMTRSDGASRLVEVRLVETQWDGRQAYLASLRDITAQKEFEQRLRFISSHDYLTGLYNRIFYTSELTKMENAGIYPYSLVILDANGLKVINDTRGHAAGDQMLRRIANLLRETFTHGEVVARIGGDEFAIIIPNADEKRAYAYLKQLAECTRLTNRDHPSGAISFAMGASTLTGPGQVQQALRLADERMYEDKKQFYLGGKGNE